MRDLQYDIVANDRSSRGFDSARANARAFNGELDMTARSYQMAANAAKLFATGFSITAVANFGSTVRGVIAEAAGLVDMADKVGVSVEDVQRMVFGFGQAGVAAGDVDQILTQWSKRIGDAYTKGGQLADILDANNMSLTDGNGHLRSSVELMRSYADLVANAGSEQEQMTLATAAFGKAGGSMVLALKDGTAGWDELMGSVEQAGGVIEEEIMRRNAEIDDQFEAMWNTFSTGAKRATLEAVAYLEPLRTAAMNWNRDYQASIAEAHAQIVAQSGGDQPEAIKGFRPNSPVDNRVGQAFGTPAVASEVEESNKRLEQVLGGNRDKYRDEFLKKYKRHTNIPSGNDDNDSPSRSGSAKAAREQESAYDRVIKKLEEERALLGLTDAARRVATEQQRAGVQATDDEGRAIASLVTAMEEQESAYKAAADASEFMRDNLKQSFGDLVPQIETGSSALDGFINRLAQAAAEALFFGDGPLGSLFGSGGGLFGGFGGGRAVGGGVDPFKDYLVGENGPELLRIGSRGGRVGGVDQGSGAAGNVHVTVGVSVEENGNLSAYVKDIARQESSSAAGSAIARYDKNMPDRMQQINRNPRKR